MTDNRFEDWMTNLSARDVEVCVLICESPRPLGFNEIQRSVGIHQEKLSRTLKRLLLHGFILKEQAKYNRCC